MTLPTSTRDPIQAHLDRLIEGHELSVARELVLSHPAVFAAYIFELNLKDFHVKTLEVAHSERRAIILFPEAHGKSTLVARILPLYELALNPNLRIVIMMKTDELAAQYASYMQQVLDPRSGNRRFLALFGNWVDKRRWTRTEMDIAPRQIHDQFPSLRFMGAKPAAVGTGCDILIADDLIHFENSRTPAAREHLSGWWHTTAQSMPRSMWDRDPKSGQLLVPSQITWPRDEQGRPREYERIIVTCTLYHVDDLISVKVGDTDELPFGELVDAPGDESYKVLYFDCFRDKDERQALWPEHRSIDWLRRERLSRGFLEFNKRLRNKPIDEASTAIKQVYIRGGDYDGVHYNGCLDRDLSVGHIEDGDLVVCGLDPGSGRTRRKSNWTGAVVLAGPLQQPNSSLPRVRVVDVHRGQYGYDDIIALAFDGNQHVGAGLHATYRYDTLAIEVNDKQVWLLQNPTTKSKMLQQPGIITSWETTGRNKLSPEIGVRSIDAAFKDSLIAIPWAQPSDQAAMTPLIDELCKFPDGHGDLVIAFWMAYRTFLTQMRSAAAFYDEEFSEGPYITNPIYDEPPALTRREPSTAASPSVVPRLSPIVIRTLATRKEHDG